MAKVPRFQSLEVGDVFFCSGTVYVKWSKDTAIDWVSGSAANFVPDWVVDCDNVKLVDGVVYHNTKLRHVAPGKYFIMLGYKYLKTKDSAGSYVYGYNATSLDVQKGNPDYMVSVMYEGKGSQMVCEAKEQKRAPLVEILQNEDGTEYSKIPNKTFFRADGFLFYKTGQGNAINIVAGNEGSFLNSELVQQVSVRIEITPV